MQGVLSLGTPDPKTQDHSILAELNDPQREAVETVDGPLLILAGAGSGKTRVLTRRIAHLIGNRDVSPSRILAMTFTNKAAKEMRERVEKALGNDAAGLWLGTFHSTCVRILRRDIGHLERSRGFVIYDDSDSVGVVKQAMKRLDLDPKDYEPKRFRWRIDGQPGWASPVTPKNSTTTQSPFVTLGYAWRSVMRRR